MRKGAAIGVMLGGMLAALAGAGRPLPAQLPAVSVDTAATKASLLAADSMLAAAVERGGAARFLAAADTDAAILFWGQPTILRGPAEARRPFLARYDRPSRYSWRPLHAIASADGRFGCTIGFSQFVSAADSVHASHGGTYATCWRRDPRGRWRVVAHQRRDSPVPALTPAHDTLRVAPHSATVSIGAAQRDAMLAAEASFSAASVEPAGPGAAFADYIAADGTLFGLAGFPVGPDAVRAVFESFIGTRLVIWVPLRSVGFASGGLGVTAGYSTSVPRRGVTGPVSYGKFMTIWRQEPDGSWKYVVDIGSPRP